MDFVSPTLLLLLSRLPLCSSNFHFSTFESYDNVSVNPPPPLSFFLFATLYYSSSFLYSTSSSLSYSFSSSLFQSTCSSFSAFPRSYLPSLSHSSSLCLSLFPNLLFILPSLPSLSISLSPLSCIFKDPSSRSFPLHLLFSSSFSSFPHPPYLPRRPFSPQATAADVTSSYEGCSGRQHSLRHLFDRNPIHSAANPSIFLPLLLTLPPALQCALPSICHPFPSASIQAFPGLFHLTPLSPFFPLSLMPLL